MSIGICPFELWLEIVLWNSRINCGWGKGEMRGEVRGLRGQQWLQGHWVFVLREVMDHCSKFRTLHSLCQYKLHHPSHGSRLRCWRRRTDSSTGSSNSLLERRLECCCCVLCPSLFSCGCWLLAKVWLPFSHLLSLLFLCVLGSGQLREHRIA